MKSFLIILSLLYCHTTLAKKVQTVYFQPKKAELIGTIESQTFPGPPNYESISSGDEIERGWYLRLNEPVDITYAPLEKAIDNDTPIKNVKVIQMIVHYRSPFKELVKVGNKVKIKGYLLGKLTGHHHARILINVEDIERVK